MKCLNCGREFNAHTVTQRYCCPKCKNQYYYWNRGKIAYPPVTFRCANDKCGRLVVTEGKKANGRPDMRTRFCCVSCEKAFWKHKHKEPTHLTNYHSMGEYASWERRTNE